MELLVKMKEKLISGTFWMSFGSILSRFMGVLYIIPWLLMLGSSQNQYTAQALFNAAYTPYSLFIVLGTSGFPTAISRQIAVFNSEGKYLESKRIFKFGLLFMAITGGLCSIIFFILSPVIANSSPVVDKQAAVIVLRTLFPALLILPIMSMIRGWFQGNQDMKPFGVSQLIEQFVRILFILMFTYISYIQMHQSLIVAVSLSTFSAFLGAVASLVYLVYCYNHNSYLYSYKSITIDVEDRLNIKTMFTAMLKEAIPFILVGSGITINQLIDQFSFSKIMENVLHYNLQEIQNMFTLFSANPNKITTVIISLALAISETTLPILASFQKDNKKVSNIIENNLKLLLTLTTPVVITLSLLSSQINTIFFGYNVHGSILMCLAISISYILCIFTDISTQFQALNHHKFAIIILLIALLLKTAFQVPLVYLFHDYGALLATGISFGIATIIGINHLLNYCQKIDNFANIMTILKLNISYFIFSLIVKLILDILPFSGNRVGALVQSVVFSALCLLGYLKLNSIFKLSPKLRDIIS